MDAAKILNSSSQTRDYSIDATLLGERTIELSVSSELPVERSWGLEVLEHTPEAVILDRFKNRAMVLYNHNRDQYIGVVEDAWLKARRLYVRVRFDTHSLAERIWNSVKNGVFYNVSIGYQIIEGLTRNDGVSLVTKWEPYELSFVTIPVDSTVGVGRSKDLNKAGAGKMADTKKGEEKMADPGTNNQEPEVRELIIKEERERCNQLRALCDKFQKRDMFQKMLSEGMTIEAARGWMLDEVGKAKQESVTKPAAVLGFSQREKNQYSIARAIKEQLGWNKEGEAGLELEAHRAIEQKVGKPAQGLYIPTRDLAWNLYARRAYEQRAPYATNAATSGENLIETDLMAEDLIYALRNRALIARLGATILSGLKDNVDIPRQSSFANTYWIAEDADVPADESNVDERVLLRPKDIAVQSAVTRRMLLQSSIDMEAFIRRDLTEGIALGIDKAAIMGTGRNNEPLGILNYPGVATIELGENGKQPTWANIVRMETEIAAANADGGMCSYLTNAKTRGKLKTTEKFQGTSGRPIWGMGNGGSEMDMLFGEVNGYPAAVSNQVPGNLTKGTGQDLSAIIFGDFSNLLCGEWGVLDLMVNPYGDGFKKARVEVRAIQTIDIQLRRPEYFSVVKDVITT